MPPAMQPRAKAKYTIHDATRETTDTLFVRNRGTRLFKKPSIVMFNVTDNAGEAVEVRVPDTWIPYDIAQDVPREFVLRSVVFRRFLANQILELVPPDEAEKVLLDGDARLEVDRLTAQRMKLSAIDPTQASRTSDGEFKMITGDTKLPKGAPGEMDEEMLGVSAAVASLVKNTDYDAAERRNILRTLVDTLSKRDCEVLRESFEDDAAAIDLIEEVELRLAAGSR